MILVEGSRRERVKVWNGLSIYKNCHNSISFRKSVPLNCNALTVMPSLSPQTSVISVKPTSEQPELRVHIPAKPGATQIPAGSIISASPAPAKMSQISSAQHDAVEFSSI